MQCRAADFAFSPVQDNFETTCDVCTCLPGAYITDIVLLHAPCFTPSTFTGSFRNTSCVPADTDMPTIVYQRVHPSGHPDHMPNQTLETKDLHMYPTICHKPIRFPPSCDVLSKYYRGQTAYPRQTDSYPSRTAAHPLQDPNRTSHRHPLTWPSTTRTLTMATKGLGGN
ncbi:uncharacterized protein LOC113565139 isoform X1 [Drosophila persimilis]|uniref:uncharacterized protein LOC113565139 isoform X1 n=1 Tax=Drosophila persimilis TaxID=7234 RepID=UPI000F0991DB|nr:uncharacterized protein LOC113565139 isoform X1 [Drosophila persimilis]